MVDVAALKEANAKRWAVARPLRDFSKAAGRLISPVAKIRYQKVAAETGVPWFFIAVVHDREAGQNFNTQLGQGDPLDRISVHVPKGRGPFQTWEAGAVDALVSCAPFASRNKDWSMGGLLTTLEAYNGFGYAARGLPSPYIWSGTDQYLKGKFIADGVFSPDVVDQQLGCAGLLMAMAKLDKDVSEGLGKRPSVPPKPAAPPPSFWEKLINLIASIFKRG